MKTLLLILCVGLLPLALLADGTPVSIATSTRNGIMHPDGSTTTVDADGTLHATGGGGGPTNGITLAQGTNVVNGIVTNSYVYQRGGSSTNQSLFAAKLTSDFNGNGNAGTNFGALGISKNLTIQDNDDGIIWNNGGTTPAFYIGMASGGPELEIEDVIGAQRIRIFDGVNGGSVTFSNGNLTANSTGIGAGTFVNMTVTNFYTVTNDLHGITVIDLATGAEATLLLAGNLTISGFQNAVAGVYNEKIVHVLPGGADRTVGVPASWKQGRYNTGVVTNGTCGDFLFSMQAGAFTNWFQLDAK